MTSPRCGCPVSMIFFSMIGSLMPYANLLTRMKSPTSSVGRIDELGILNGSAMNERSRNTISRTGKKLFGYSIHHGSGSPGRRRRAKTSRSASVITPVTTVSRKSIRAKFIVSSAVGGFLLLCRSFLADLENGQERFLRNLDAADRLHPLLSRLLLFEQLALARDVAAVAFGQHVLAQGLDALAGDDLRADRRLDRDVEHLTRDQRAHLR